MIYIITGYVGVLILVILLYYRYSEFRVKSVAENKSLIEKYEAQLNDLRQENTKIMQEGKGTSDKMESVLSELNNLRKEKENEAKMRLSAEKQVEIAMQRAEDIENRINDWQEMQDAVMRDCMDSILKVGNDLYKKLNESYKNEVETTKNLLAKFTKNIVDSTGKSPVAAAPTKSPTQTQESPTVGSSSIKKAVEGVVEMASSGSLVGRDYFLPQNFDAKIAPLVLCELVFLKKQHLYFIDFKALRYLEEYNSLKAKDQKFATDNLKQRLDKYLAYLSNPKYNDSILKALAPRKIKYDKVVNVLFVSKADDLAILKEIGYQAKAESLKIELVDEGSIANITL